MDRYEMKVVMIMAAVLAGFILSIITYTEVSFQPTLENYALEHLTQLKEIAKSTL